MAEHKVSLSSESTKSRGWLYLVLLTLQYGAQPLLTKRFIRREVIVTSVVLSCEIAKVFCGIILSAKEGSLKRLHKEWTLVGSLTAAGLPAAIYALQNSLLQISYKNLDSLTFSMLNQTKLFFTALFMYLILGQKQSIQQFGALGLLLIAAILLSIGEGSGKGSSGSNPDQIFFHGIVPVFVASVLSGLASSLCQWATQVKKHTSYLMTVEMSIFGSLCLLASISKSPDGVAIRQNGFFHGWTTWTLVGQLNKIYEMFGGAYEHNWPGVSNLPSYNELKPTREVEGRFKQTFKNDNQHAVNLLERMLALDPSQRISAKEALEEEYFSIDSVPCDPQSLSNVEYFNFLVNRRNKKLTKFIKKMISEVVALADVPIDHQPDVAAQAPHPSPVRQPAPEQPTREVSVAEVLAMVAENNRLMMENSRKMHERLDYLEDVSAQLMKRAYPTDYETRLAGARSRVFGPWYATAGASTSGAPEDVGDVSAAADDVTVDAEDQHDRAED